MPWSDSEQYALVGRNLVRTSGSAKPIHRGPRTLIDTPFAVLSIAADEILLVTLRFRAGAEGYAIKAFMFQIADAFAEVERLSEKNMKGLFWEQKRLSLTEHCVVLRRSFRIPTPQKVDAELRERTGDIKNISIH